MAAASPQPEQTPPDEASRTLHLSDAATTEDAFGSHRRVAQAIAKLIRESPAGFSIALTGSWGSGKSSVVEMLDQELQQSAGANFEPRLFLFDAWAHQGDPLRRSFLESLIAFAGQRLPGLETPGTEEWTKELDRVTGRLETSVVRADKPLKASAILAAVSLLFCIPLGTAFLGRYNGDKYSFWTSPFSLAAVFLFAMPLLLGLWALYKDRKVEALKALLLREAEQVTETTTVKTREPNSIDFRRVFFGIAAFLLKHPQRRLIVVIDNLDRIDAEAAVSMWGTMRVFFETIGQREEWRDRLWLLVPFDRTALRKLWKPPSSASQQQPAPPGFLPPAPPSHQGADAMIDSFLNKTFQMTFHVSPPVLTKWKQYFDAQLKRVFPDSALAKERDFVYRIFSVLGPPTPSPREIKIFINKLSALYIQWPESADEALRIELPFLATYVLLGNSIGEDNLRLLEPGFLSADAVSILSRYNVDAEPLQKIAAVHFGVPSTEALQVLLGSRIVRSVQEGDFETLERLQSGPYFWTVFIQKADDQHEEWSLNPAALTNLVKFLEMAQPPEKDRFALEIVWEAAVGTGCHVRDWGPMDSDRAAAFSTLLTRAASNASHFDGFAAAALDNLKNSELELDEWVVALAAIVSAVGRHSRGQDALRRFRVAAETPERFFRMYLAGARQNVLETVARYVDTAAPRAIPGMFLANAEPAGEAALLRAKAVLQRKYPEGWDEFDSAIAAQGDSLSPDRYVVAMRLISQYRPARAAFVEKMQALQPMATSLYISLVEQGRLREAAVVAAASTEIREQTNTALTDFLLANIDDLQPELVADAYRSLPHVREPLMAAALASRPFFQASLEAAYSLADPRSTFDWLLDWLPRLPQLDRELMGLHLAARITDWTDEERQRALNSVTSALLLVVMDASGSAWMPLGRFMAMSEAGVDSDTWVRLQSHLKARNEIGVGSVEDLTRAAAREPKSKRDHLLDLAMQRAGGDYALAGAARPQALVAWGRTLLERARYLPWGLASAFIKDAQSLFERALETGAGVPARAALAECAGRLAQPLTDAEARASLTSTIEAMDKALAEAPGDRDVLSVLGAALVSRAARAAKAQEREADLVRAQHALETIDAPSHRDRLRLVDCLIARATQTRPFDSALLDAAARALQPVLDNNANSLDALRRSAAIAMNRAVNLPWSAAEPLLAQARERLDAALALDPGDYHALCLTGDLLSLLARNRPAEQAKELLTLASEKFRDAARIDPSWPNAFVGAGWTALLTARRLPGEFEQAAASAAEAAAKAIEIRPDSVPPLRILGNLHRLEGQRVPRADADARFTAAFERFRRAAELRPGDPFILIDWAFTLVDQGYRRSAADALGPLSEALAKADEALALRPNEPDALVARGDALRLRARAEASPQRESTLAESAEAYRHALAAAPDLDSALTGCALVEIDLSQAPEFSQEGLLEKAEARSRRALALRSDNWLALQALGDIYFLKAGKADATTNLETARSHYEQAVRANPGPESLRSQLRIHTVGSILAPHNTEPLDALRTLASRHGDAPQVHAALGDALLRHTDGRGDAHVNGAVLEEAWTAFRRAIDLNPSETGPYRALLQTLESLAKIGTAEGIQEEMASVRSRLDQLASRTRQAIA